MDAKSTKRPCTALIVLDGWGYRAETEHNAIAAAATPNWDAMWQNRPTALVSGSGLDVGLPDGQMGNSEVGHMNLGAGRVVHQDLTRIELAIKDKSFHKNPVLLEAINQAKSNGGALHVFGLLSAGGVHSHENQINEFIQLAADKGTQQLYLHAFLDGRDTPPRSAGDSIAKTQALFAKLYPTTHPEREGRIASLAGRYYAMDRDKRWDRVEKAWDCLVNGHAAHTASTAVDALNDAYARDENDEFVLPTLIANEQQQPAAVRDGDVVVFMNYRADRARELTQAFTIAYFDGFKNQPPKLSAFVTLTEYADSLPVDVAYPPETLHNTLGEYLADLDKTQLRIAETEKYAHVTFFFSGGREATFPGEQRTLVPSPDVATYDLQPEMSATELTDKLVQAIDSGEFDVVICNYANGDMVGHSGVFDAAIKACETIDQCLGRIDEAIKRNNGQCLITADHGNVEQMHNPQTSQAHTAHTCEPVPLVYLGNKDLQLKPGGTLSDIAPTLLKLMGLPQPVEMTGTSLAIFDAPGSERAIDKAGPLGTSQVKSGKPGGQQKRA